MAKQKKSVDFDKKKGNAVAANKATNGVIKNKSADIKKKNKKNKKVDADNGAMKPNFVSKKNKKPSPTIVAQETTTSPPTKVIADKVVAAEILSNPKISKKKLKKKNAQAPVSSPIKEKNKKVVEVDLEVDDVEDIAVEQEEPTKPVKKRKKSKKVSKEVSKEDVVEDTNDDDTENDVNPLKKKKQKLKKAKETAVVSKEDVVEDTNNDDTETDVTPTKKKKQKLKKIKDVAVTESEEGTTANPTKPDKTPMVSVFVGNLPINTKRGKILKLFSKFGKVKSIRFRLSNGGKFFKSQSKVTAPNVIAFVDFENDEDAKSSLVLNGEKIRDNVIRVDLQSKAKTADSFDGKRTVFVGNLKYSVTDQNLHDLFSCCGDIEYARTMQCEKGCNGIGYVCFKKTESVGMALELNNSDVQGRPVRVQRYVKKTPGGPKEKKNKK